MDGTGIIFWDVLGGSKQYGPTVQLSRCSRPVSHVGSKDECFVAKNAIVGGNACYGGVRQRTSGFRTPFCKDTDTISCCQRSFQNSTQQNGRFYIVLWTNLLFNNSWSFSTMKRFEGTMDMRNIGPDETSSLFGGWNPSSLLKRCRVPRLGVPDVTVLHRFRSPDRSRRSTMPL